MLDVSCRPLVAVVIITAEKEEGDVTERVNTERRLFDSSVKPEVNAEYF